MSSELVEAFHGGPYDGRTIKRLELSEDRGMVGPGGEFYERARELDAGSARAWRFVPGRTFRGNAARVDMDGDLQERPAPVGLATLAVDAAGKEQPVNLGQLRSLVKTATDLGFEDETPVRALVYMRGTAKKLELRAK